MCLRSIILFCFSACVGVKLELQSILIDRPDGREKFSTVLLSLRL